VSTHEAVARALVQLEGGAPELLESLLAPLRLMTSIQVCIVTVKVLRVEIVHDVVRLCLLNGVCSSDSSHLLAVAVPRSATALALDAGALHHIHILQPSRNLFCINSLQAQWDPCVRDRVQGKREEESEWVQARSAERAAKKRQREEQEGSRSPAPRSELQQQQA
jgi:hypothetical protein